MLNAALPPRRLPSVREAVPLLTMLFGTDIDCKPRKEPLAAKDCMVVATYSDNTGKIQRLLACDLAFANSAGAALSAIPPAAANNATKAGKLADNVVENLSEVMNVAVNLLIESFGSRLELISVLNVADATPQTIAALSSAQRVKIDITIPRYDVGRLDIISVS